jgi:zinc/manganese transport system substrate-binding protein
MINNNKYANLIRHAIGTLSMRTTGILGIAALVILVVGGAASYLYLSGGPTSTTTSNQSSTSKIQVVAGENFWGSLVSQLGGSRVNVTSIVSDPNTDPHEYESNPSNARAISDAKFVVVNGAGYDTWALNIIAAANTPNQVVLNVQELLNQPVDANPHFWYSPYYVNSTVAAMYKDLVKIDPSDKSYFTTQYADLNSSLWTSYMKQETLIKQQFSGAPVAATESIFVYMANATGLNIVTPPEFMKALAEGNDPSAQDVATFEQQLMGGNSTVHLLVYNAQTVTPLTQSLLSLASQHEIPYIRISETIQPPNYTFQAWMQGEVAQLQNGLNAAALGQ